MLFKEELLEHARMLKGDNALQLQDDAITQEHGEAQEQGQDQDQEQLQARSPPEIAD